MASKILMLAAVILSMSISDKPQLDRSTDSTGSLADLRPLEVRMRRLHRVRPDLLHYPLQYDIYC